MKLTALDEDLKIHQKLEDEPNDVGGLSAQELKEKFDQAGLTIQKYLNETHLPEEEKALADALAEAMEYTDQKVVELGKGDMAAAVYDTKKRRKDIFDYVDEKTGELKGQTPRSQYAAAGHCRITARDAVVELDQFETLVDPRGLWSEEEKAFIAPEGAAMAVVTACVIWAKQSGSNCYLRVMVNGEVKGEREGSCNTTGSFMSETVMVPVPVQGGDQVQIELEGKIIRDGSHAELRQRDIRVEFIL